MENIHKHPAPSTIKRLDKRCYVELLSRKKAEKMGVKILHQFHSGLEHTFLWVVDADNAHLIQELMERTAGTFNTVKIVPLITFQEVLERCKQIEEGTFFRQDVTE